MAYSYDKFLRPISSSDVNIQILDNDGKIVYTINPFSISTSIVLNNLLKINLKGEKVILIPFSTTNEAKLAISKFESGVNILTRKTPVIVDKQIENYVYSKVNNGTSGTSGTSGLSGTSGTSGSSGSSGSSGTSGVDGYNGSSGTSGSSGITNNEHNNLVDRDIAGNHAKLVPSSDSTTSLQLTKADGVTPIINVDTINNRVGFNTIPTNFMHFYTPDGDPNEPFQNIDVMVDGGNTSDKGFVWSDQGNRRWQQNIYRGEDGSLMYIYNFESNQELLTYSNMMKIGVNKQSNIINYHSSYMNREQGSIDDLKISGTYNNGIQRRYRFYITTTGAVDKFRYKHSIDQGATWTEPSPEIDCSLTDILIEHGIYVRFKNLTGHNLYDVWERAMFPQAPEGTLTVAPPYIDEIEYVDDYLSPTPNEIDLTYTFSDKRSPSCAIFEIGSTSGALYCGRGMKYHHLDITVVTSGVG